jgi:hypothetical protein
MSEPSVTICPVRTVERTKTMNKLLTVNPYVMADEIVYRNVCKSCPSYDACVETCDDVEAAVRRIESAFKELLPIVANKPYPDEG